MSLKLGVVRGAVSLGGARIVINVLNAASILVLARLLTPNDFGIVAIASSVLSVVLSVTEVSLQPSLVQCPDATREHVDTVWTMALIRSGLTLAFFVIAAFPLASVYSDPRLVPVFFVSGITGAFMGLYNPRISLATRDMRFGPLTMFQICQKFVGLALAIVLAVALGSFWAIIIGTAIGAGAATLLSYFLVPYRPRLTLVHAGEIWGFSGWLFVSQLCETLNWRFDQLAIGLVAPKAALGQYSVADNLAAIPSREMSLPLTGALFAGMATINGDNARLTRSYLRAQSTLAMVTVPAAVGLALIAEPAVRVALGDRWLGSVPFLQVLALSYGLDTLISVVRPLGMAMGRTKLLFVRQLSVLCVRIPLILAGLSLGGLAGAAAGRLASGFVICLISMMLARQLLGVSVWRQVSAHALTLSGAAAMCVAVLFAKAGMHTLLAPHPALALLVLGGIGAIVYTASVLLFWLARGRPEGAAAEIAGMVGRLTAIRRLQAEARL